MFSFFKRKPKVSNDATAQGVDLYLRVARLGSRDLDFFKDLLGITDEVSDRVYPIFEGFPDVKFLEVHGVIACIVVTAIKVSSMKEDEKREVIDIYLDLWVGSIVEKEPRLDGKILKGSVERMWQSAMPGILRAAVGEQGEEPGIQFAPVVLLHSLDRLCGIRRPENAVIEDGASLRKAIVFGINAVEAL